MPCVAAGSIDCRGVFRLHIAIGFADDYVSLKMTELKDVTLVRIHS
jgi:hypothetical protein